MGLYGMVHKASFFVIIFSKVADIGKLMSLNGKPKPLSIYVHSTIGQTIAGRM